MDREPTSRDKALMRRQDHHGEHFWVASYPFFDTALIITPPRGLEESTDTCWSTVDVFDCDGEKVNSVELTFPPSDVATFQLDPLMGSCKLESGFKISHVVVHPHLAGVTHRVRAVSYEHACFIGPTFSTFPNRPAFFPTTFAPGKHTFIAVVNYGEEDASVRLRLFFGTRTPEMLCHVPALGARIVSVNTEFSDCAERAVDRSMQAYIRVTTKSDAGLGVQLLERTEGAKDTNLFYSLA